MADLSSIPTSNSGLAEDLLHRQLLQLVMDNLPECIFWKDINSVYLGCNHKFAVIAGVGSPEKIIGKTDYGQLTSRMGQFYCPLVRLKRPEFFSA